jgi:hypothetical protein
MSTYEDISKGGAGKLELLSLRARGHQRTVGILGVQILSNGDRVSDGLAGVGVVDRGQGIARCPISRLHR